MNINKIYPLASRGVAALLFLIGLIVTVLIYSAGKESFESRVQLGIDVAIYSVVLIIVVFAIFMIRGVILNPRTLIKSGLSLGVIIILFFVFYQMSSDYVTLEGKSVEYVAMVKTIPSSTLKMIEAGISTMFLLLGLSLAALLGTEIWKIFK